MSVALFTCLRQYQCVPLLAAALCLQANSGRCDGATDFSEVDVPDQGSAMLQRSLTSQKVRLLVDEQPLAPNGSTVRPRSNATVELPGEFGFAALSKQLLLVLSAGSIERTDVGNPGSDDPGGLHAWKRGFDAQVTAFQMCLLVLCGVLLGVFVSVTFVMICKIWWRPKCAIAPLRRTVERMKILQGIDFPLDRDLLVEHSAEERSSLPQASLVRVEGRVVAGTEGALVAPLSGSQCVVCSTSVLRCPGDVVFNDNGVRQPLIAFHNAKTDFRVELQSLPTNVFIDVHCADVELFDMVDGKIDDEKALNESPENWKEFVLANVTVGTAAPSEPLCRPAGTQGVLVGEGPLEFRECALNVGSMVTCVGELVRDKSGSFGLHPWQPRSGTPRRRCPWGWKSVHPENGAETNPLRIHVLVSDDPCLLQSRQHHLSWLKQLVPRRPFRMIRRDTMSCARK